MIHAYYSSKRLLVQYLCIHVYTPSNMYTNLGVHTTLHTHHRGIIVCPSIASALTLFQGIAFGTRPSHSPQNQAHPQNVYAHTSRCNRLQHTTIHCSTLQHTATYCNRPQQTATYYSHVLGSAIDPSRPSQPSTSLKNIYTHTTHGNTLQQTATYCIILLPSIGFGKRLFIALATRHIAEMSMRAQDKTTHFL